MCIYHKPYKISLSGTEPVSPTKGTHSAYDATTFSDIECLSLFEEDTREKPSHFPVEPTSGAENGRRADDERVDEAFFGCFH